MITNKDLSIDSENGKIILNGDKYDLGTQGEIDTAVKGVYSVMGQNGAKNLIPYPYVNTSQTINNVAFTVNGDGSISVDNVASAITQFRLYGWATGLSPFLLRKGTYILSGCPSGGGVNSLRLYLHNQDSSITIVDDGEGARFTLSDDTYVGIAIRVANGYDADGKNVYPMIRLASDTDNTYEPYAMTNKQLTDQLGALDTKIGNKITKLARKDLSYTCTSTNLEYTGLNVTCPASHAYIVRARLSFSSTAPSEILVSASSTSSSVYNRLAYGESGYATLLLLAGESAYVWGKWGATGENSASVEIIDITL